MTERHLVYPDHTAKAIVPFADCLVVTSAAEQGNFVNPVPLVSGRSLWFPRMLRRLEKLLENLLLDATEFVPGRDGKSAYVMLNNDGDLSDDAVSQSRVYRIDAQGSHMLFSTLGKYSIWEISPLDQDRIIYLRRTINEGSDQQELRLYDLMAKSSKTIVADEEISAVWMRK